MKGVTIVLAAFICAVGLVTPSYGQSQGSGSLDQNVVEIASNFCVEALLESASIPAPGPAFDAFVGNYGLNAGIPSSAIEAFSPNGTDSFLSEAILASWSEGSDGFVVAIGGALGNSCRIIVYSASDPQGLGNRVYELMSHTPYGWEGMSPVPGPAQTVRHRATMTTDTGRSFGATLVTPPAEDSLELALFIIALPNTQ